MAMFECSWRLFNEHQVSKADSPIGILIKSLSSLDSYFNINETNADYGKLQQLRDFRRDFSHFSFPPITTIDCTMTRAFFNEEMGKFLLGKLLNAENLEMLRFKGSKGNMKTEF